MTGLHGNLGIFTAATIMALLLCASGFQRGVMAQQCRETSPIIEKSESPKVSFNLIDIRRSSHVGLHAQLLEYDITRSDGANVGRNPVQTAPPGGVVQCRWYAGDSRLQRTVGNRFRLIAAPVEFGGLNLMPADRVERGTRGLWAPWSYIPGMLSCGRIAAPAPRPPSGAGSSRFGACVTSPWFSRTRPSCTTREPTIPCP